MSSPQGSGTFRGVADEAHQSGVVGDGERDMLLRPPLVGRPYALTARCPSGSSRTLSVVRLNLSPRRVSVHRCDSGIVTLIASAVTSTPSPLLMKVMVPQPTHRRVPSFLNELLRVSHGRTNARTCDEEVVTVIVVWWTCPTGRCAAPAQ